jgi:hypothetical protein
MQSDCPTINCLNLNSFETDIILFWRGGGHLRNKKSTRLTLFKSHFTKFLHYASETNIVFIFKKGQAGDS